MPFEVGGDDHFNIGEERVDALQGFFQSPTCGDFSKGGSTSEFSDHSNDELGVLLNNQHVKTFSNFNVEARF